MGYKYLYVVYKSVHLYNQWVEGGPPGARYNRSKSGWFDETTFTDWLFKLMLPKLRRLEGRKVLIGDNLSSHLSGESESDDSDGSDDASTETSDADDEEVLTVSDINVGDFALVKYKYSRSIKYYIGECMEKDTSGEISFIFLERICGSLFKYRENVIRETANISMVKNILAAPSVTRRGGKLDFNSSKEVIDRLRCLY